ncbi:hypothetical protein [Kitasatospora sp. HPMI-4]|uniref:hypothetical protein n=1 Tax=Kitasatospora sp. HPMI-4 TaxID=3448443 RepID=UPI003F19D6E2
MRPVLQAWRRIGYKQATTAIWPWTATGVCTALAAWAPVATVLAVFTSDHREQ